MSNQEWTDTVMMVASRVMSLTSLSNPQTFTGDSATKQMSNPEWVEAVFSFRAFIPGSAWR